MSKLLTRDDVRQLASLVEIELSTEEVEMLSHDLNDMLRYFDILQTVRTAPPASQSHAWRTSGVPVRRDVAQQSFVATELSELAGDRFDETSGCFRFQHLELDNDSE